MAVGPAQPTAATQVASALAAAIIQNRDIKDPPTAVAIYREVYTALTGVKG